MPAQENAVVGTVRPRLIQQQPPPHLKPPKQQQRRRLVQTKKTPRGSIGSSTRSSRGPAAFRRSDYCWITLWLITLYGVGIQWGMYLAANTSSSYFEGRFSMEDALDSKWSVLWEMYNQPILETLFALDDDSMGPRKAGKIAQAWTPEIPQFQAPSQLKLPKPIINVGFPKAGTSSIFSFFHCNGLKGQHWFCCEEQHHPAGTEHQHLMSRCILNNIIANNQNQLRNSTQLSNATLPRPPKVFEGCGEYDFYSEINGPRMFKDLHFQTINDDGQLSTLHQSRRKPRMILPQHHYLDVIHQQYPNATFILNVRPAQEWVDSVIRWGSGLKEELVNEFWYQDIVRNFTTFVGTNISRYSPTSRRPKSSSAKAASSTDAYYNATLLHIMEYHSKYIRDFVQNHPSHALIEVDITNNDTGRVLANAFGLNETCWGHRNENNKAKRKPKRKALGHSKGDHRRRHKRTGHRPRGSSTSREHGNELLDEEPNEEDMDDDHEAFTEKYKQIRVERMERWNSLNDSERKRRGGTNADWRTKDYKIEGRDHVNEIWRDTQIDLRDSR